MAAMVKAVRKSHCMRP